MRLDVITCGLSSIADIISKSGLDATSLWSEGDGEETFVKTSLAVLSEKVVLDGSLNGFSVSVKMLCYFGMLAEMNWNEPSSLRFASGDRIPDFTKCGCWNSVMKAGSSSDMPSIVVKPSGDTKDRTRDIQQAIDEASKFPLREDGFRAAILLEAGDFWIHGTGISIKASGVVVRGSAGGKSKLICACKHEGTLFRVEGPKPPREKAEQRRKILNHRLAVGECEVRVESVEGLAKWQTVRVVREGNAKWIHDIGMDNIPQRPKVGGTKMWGPMQLVYERKIVAIDETKTTVTLDIGITTALEQKYGGGYIVPFNGDYRIKHVGIEDLHVVCLVNEAKCVTKNGVKLNEDEEHLDRVACFDNAALCWIRRVNSQGFGFHTYFDAGAKQVTAIDCHSFAPAAKVEGGKRYGFTIAGQLILVDKCSVEHARHGFAVHSRVCGPNVFHDCKAINQLGCSETHHRWGNGVLYDVCEGAIAIQDRAWMGSGQGWSGANCIVWNCKGSVTVQHPPTAYNYCVANRARVSKGKSAFPKQNEDASFVWLDDMKPWSLLSYQRSLNK